MMWRPPAGWDELSAASRAAYLGQRGMQIPLRPADWDSMEHEQRMAYLNWTQRILHDTPEARAAKWQEYGKELRAWRVLMGWWCLCLLVGLALVWGAGPLGEGLWLRVLITVFVLGGYAMAIFVPMLIARPVPPA